MPESGLARTWLPIQVLRSAAWGCIMQEVRSDVQWLEDTCSLEPTVSLVYPSVYPAKVDGGEIEDGRGTRRVFGFRPRPPLL